MFFDVVTVFANKPTFSADPGQHRNVVFMSLVYVSVLAALLLHYIVCKRYCCCICVYTSGLFDCYLAIVSQGRSRRSGRSGHGHTTFSAELVLL